MIKITIVWKGGYAVLNTEEPFKFIIDDDILVHPEDIIKMQKLNETMVGIYGKSNV